MPLEKIFVTRHGFRSNWTVDPATGIYAASIPSPTGIPADPALTSHGVQQSKELARHLMDLDPPIDLVYSSPYYRCLQTISPYVELRKQRRAEGVQPPLDTTIRPEFGLCEWFGSAPFDHPQPASPHILKAMFPAYDEDYVSGVVPSSKGETLVQLYERVARGLRAIIDRCDAENKRSVVLCSHAAVIIAIGRILTGQVPESPDTEDFRAFTCGLSLYTRDPAEHGASVDKPANYLFPAIGRWNCELNGDCSFLSSGEERGWCFSGDESFPGTGSMTQVDGSPKL
ncbi:histidine phosphatase superfamily [Stachybotrys elegans]|uniref:Histidine phosphatase superfamily n=1 Tax=Stachybotrys elegans TaxID=80388 RepID=A0A8K0T8K3_9HYPO|nr:histidine phosphatase superfamily [Stachybotrys elegans]